jgi:hypothetical protein
MQFESGGAWLVWIFMAGVVVWSFRASALKKQADRPLSALRERRASELGWRYDGAYEGDIRYRFFGTTSNGQAWELYYDSDASSTGAQPKLVWQIASLRSKQIEFQISHARGFDAMRTGAGKHVASFAAGLASAVGSSSVRQAMLFLKEAVAQPVGTARFRTRFTVMARDRAGVERLLDNESERLLLNWPKSVEKKFDPFKQVSVFHDLKGLRIECRYDATDMPLVEHIVKLGTALSVRLLAAG